MKPYKYQDIGSLNLTRTFLSGQKGAVLADEPGVGKTAQACLVANFLASRSVCVICPSIAKVNWQREMDSWSAWGVDLKLISTKEVSPLPPDVVVNYDIIWRIPALLEQKFDLVICDESHYLKSPKSKRSKAAKKICDKAGSVLLLSGTPLENRPVELFWQMVCMGWLEPGQQDQYEREFCDKKLKRIYMRNKPRRGYVLHWDEDRMNWYRNVPTGRNNFKKVFKEKAPAAWEIRYDGKRKLYWREIEDVSGASNLPKLRKILLSKGMLRRTKAEVMPELPPKTNVILEMPRKSPWRSRILQEALGDSFMGGTVKTGQIKYFKSLAQAVKTPADKQRLVESIAKARRLDGEAKVPQVIEFVRDMLEGGVNKIVVFAHHKEVIEALTDGLKEFGAKSVYGGTSAKKRQATIDAFQDPDSGTRVFVGNYKAAGTAITLTQAHHVVLAELDWIPGVVSQAIDRCHRNGQKDNVTAYYLVFEDSTDALVVKSIVEKQKTLDYLLDGVEPPKEVWTAVDPLDALFNEW